MIPLEDVFIQTLRAFRRAVQVDVIEELNFQRPVHEDGPGRQLGGPKPDQEAKLEGQSWLRSPNWRSKSDLGGQLGGPKLTQEVTSETQARKEANLNAERSPQDANLEAERLPRRPTLEAKGGPGPPLGAKMEQKGVPKGAKRLQK